MFTDILWDFDGTLFDTYPGLVDTMLRALSDEGIREEPIARSWPGSAGVGLRRHWLLYEKPID